MKPNQRVILSHGGRHGKQAGTYAPGQLLSREQAALIPNQYLRTPSQKSFAPSTNNISTTRNKPSEADKVIAAMSGLPKVPEPIQETPQVEPDVVVNVEMPSSKSQLATMRKSELVALAESLDIDATGTATVLRDRLLEELF